MEYRLRTGSGDYRWFSERGQAVWDEQGRAVRMSGSLRDITDADEPGARRYPGPHDLRVPLAIVESLKQSLLEGRAAERDGDRSAFVTRLASAGQRMARLIDDLQALSWAMDKELHRQPVDLGAIARPIVRKLRKTHGKRPIVFSIAGGLVVEGDAALLRVMMENLLDNAWKFTGKHPLARVEFGAAEQEDGDEAYYVRDDGAGFDMAHADRLFGLFQRLHPAAEFEGTGVGLTTVRHIVERHGGSVWAEGQVETGATFYFRL